MLTGADRFVQARHFSAARERWRGRRGLRPSRRPYAVVHFRPVPADWRSGGPPSYPELGLSERLLLPLLAYLPLV